MTQSNENPTPPPAVTVEEPTLKKRSRLPFWLRDLAFAGLAFWAISVWQNADLVETGKRAPDFQLTALDGTVHGLATETGKPVLLYFFAPWCKVCKVTAHNVRALRDAKTSDEVTIYAVALQYGSRESVEGFVAEHSLGDVPVLLGDDAVLRNYNIRAFPTFYTIDPQGVVSGRTQGYTSEVGLRMRLAGGKG